MEDSFLPFCILHLNFLTAFLKASFFMGIRRSRGFDMLNATVGPRVGFRQRYSLVVSCHFKAASLMH